MKLVFKRPMRFTAMVLMCFMIVGLFPMGALGADEPIDNDRDAVIDWILETIQNEEYSEELQRRLDSLTWDDMNFLLEKFTQLAADAPSSILPESAKERLEFYGVNRATISAFLDDVFDADHQNVQEKYQEFVDAFTALLEENATVEDLGTLSEYFDKIYEAFDENFPAAREPGEDKISAVDLTSLATAFFTLLGRPMDPFNLTDGDQEFINETIGDMGDGIKEKLQLDEIDWTAYDNTIKEALENELITKAEKLRIQKLLGVPVTVDPGDIEEDIDEEENKVDITLPALPTTPDGKTVSAKVLIQLTDAACEALGLQDDTTITMVLPPLQLLSGQAPIITFKKVDTGILGSRDEQGLAIDITIVELDGQTVTVTIPIGELDLETPGAFHWNESEARWEFRSATVDNDQLSFVTDLSPVFVGEAVAVPTITDATTTTSSVTLTWTSVADSVYSSVYYEVYRDDSFAGGIEVTGDTDEIVSYTIHGLSSNTPYTFKVKAIDADGFESDFSAPFDATTSRSSGGGGGGGGGSSSGYTISDSEVTKQLNAGNKDITITVPKGTTTIKISYQTYNKIVAAGKDLVIHTDKVSLRIPAGAFDVSGTGVITLKVGELTDAASKAAVDKLDANAKLLGKVFDITSSTAPKKAIEVTISYDGADLSGIDEGLLDVYWYNEATGAWESMDGRVDKGDNAIEFSTTHFSKYAVVAYEKAEEVPTFKDIANHWAKADIEFMAGKGIIKGISATEFAPNNPITRAEFAALLVRALGLEADTGYALSFTDVSKSKWYYGEVAAAFKAGVVEGTSATTFAPNANITREQMAAMITRAMAEAGKAIDMTDAQVQEKLAKFKDAANIASWAQAEVAKAVEFGIIEGRTADTFVAKANATRAEGAVMIKRMYDQIQ
ncbi:MAG: S-layer homology domain-containing protein [Dehalobacterium sp.]